MTDFLDIKFEITFESIVGLLICILLYKIIRNQNTDNYEETIKKTEEEVLETIKNTTNAIKKNNKVKCKRCGSIMYHKQGVAKGGHEYNFFGCSRYSKTKCNCIYNNISQKYEYT